MSLWQRLASVFGSNSNTPRSDADGTGTGTAGTGGEPGSPDEPRPPRDPPERRMGTDELLSVGRTIEEGDRIRLNERLHGTVAGIEELDVSRSCTVAVDGPDGGTVQLDVSKLDPDRTTGSPVKYMSVAGPEPEWVAVETMERLDDADGTDSGGIDADSRG